MPEADHDITPVCAMPATGEDIETQFVLDAFPAPALLWKRYKTYRGIEDKEEPLVLQPFHEDLSGKEPRYYQADAVNRTVEAVAEGDDSRLYRGRQRMFNPAILPGRNPRRDNRQSRDQLPGSRAPSERMHRPESVWFSNLAEAE